MTEQNRRWPLIYKIHRLREEQGLEPLPFDPQVMTTKEVMGQLEWLNNIKMLNLFPGGSMDPALGGRHGNVR